MSFINKEKANDDESNSEVISSQAWKNRRQFLLSSIGYIVGLGNFWRFPWLIKEYGGGACLLVYMILFAVIGLPLLYLELSIGRCFRTSLTRAWSHFSPFMIGIGFVSVVISFLTCCYYMVVISWCFLYFLRSFQYPLPWTHLPNVTSTNSTSTSLMFDVVQNYWYYNTLNISDSISDGWTIPSNLFLSYTLTWILMFLSLYRGIETTGKVVHFMAIFPYLALCSLLVRCLFLDGAISVGLKYFVTVQWDVVFQADVWYNSAIQVIYSMGMSSGVWITYSSLCEPQQNLLSDTLIISLADIVSSILGALVTFTILGYRATRQHNECLEIGAKMKAGIVNFNCNKNHLLDQETSGSGLAFITFSESIVHLPGAPFFSVLFFLMLVSLGMDSVFGMIEVVRNALQRWKFLAKLHDVVPFLAICSLIYLIGLSMVTRSGEYIMQILQVYATDLPLIVVTLCEVLCLTLLYGVKRFSKDVFVVNQQRVPCFFKACWYLLSPLVLATVICVKIYSYFKTRFQFSSWDKVKCIQKQIPFSTSTTVIAVTLCVTALLPLPFGAIYTCLKRRRRKSKCLLNGEHTILSSHMQRSVTTT